MAIGMKAMVLLNVATEADIANGTRGEIQDIMDEREDSLVRNEDGSINLKYPPAMLLFRPYKKTNLTFPGLPPGVIPLTPSQVSFMATGRTDKKFKISRRQYAMTSGYAFTDYKSQGQTIEYVIIDIGIWKATYRITVSILCLRGALTKQRQGHNKAAQRFRCKPFPTSSIRGLETRYGEAQAIERHNQKRLARESLRMNKRRTGNKRHTVLAEVTST
jgi:hypothetical protein